MIDKYLSDKLKVISFFSMLMVVFLHSYNLGEEILNDTSVTKGYDFFIQFFISQGIARVAVPIFFVISGYLLFLNKKNTFDEYLLILKKRFKSLVIPYLFWSFSLFFIFLLLQSLPQIGMFFKQKHIIDYNFHEVLETIFVHPIPFQFWFIRDLFVLMIFSPLLYALVRFFKILTLFVFLITWWFQIDFVIFSNEAILFFVLGLFLVINKIDLNVSKLFKNSIFLVLLWFLLVFSETLLIYKGFLNKSIINSLHKFGILVGLFAVWSFYDFLFKKAGINSKFLSLTQMSFFIYAFHEPLLEIIKIVFYKILGESQFLKLLLYVTSPLFVISISIFLGLYLKRVFPNFFSIITGGR
ncbi:acyltransferase family protein [Flavobacterium sp. PS2]|uniref:acyltransferase family protein n=1 Tax=Flavobacterium sp. PS2 TaxID=3384157 RepID=UPI00390CBCE1